MGGRVPDVCVVTTAGVESWVSGEAVMSSGEDEYGRFFKVAQAVYRGHFLRESEFGKSWRWPETAADAEKQKRQRKVGLCKRRGCKNPCMDDGKRLCGFHAGLLTVDAPAIPQAEATADTEPHPARDVELYCGLTANPQWKRAKVATVSAGGFVLASGDSFHWSSEGKAWRWADTCITQDCSGFRVQGDVFCADCMKVLGRTSAPVDPIPEEAEQPSDGQPVSVDLLKATHGKNGVPAMPVVPERFGAHDGQEFGNERQPRVCAGVPGALGDNRCDVILGEDIKGERCSRCESVLAMFKVDRGACLRSGCLRPCTEGSRYCGHHKRISETVAGTALAQAFEAAWDALADNPECDPATVAVCKQLRDAEILR